jgi:hypothetical protein
MRWASGTLRSVAELPSSVSDKLFFAREENVFLPTTTSSPYQILERAMKRLGSIWIVVLREKYSITRFMSTKKNELSACRLAPSKS